MRRELNLYGIGVVVVAPATVDTPIWDEPESAIGRYGETDYGEAFDKSVRAIVDAGRQHSLQAGDVAQTVMKALTVRAPASVTRRRSTLCSSRRCRALLQSARLISSSSRRLALSKTRREH
jgi:NAD(P)-dependent dehydrogenase (short-subunit alcohol dehydrogenase family)